MPLILKPSDLTPGMVLKEPVRKGSATLLPEGKSLTEFDIDTLQRKWPQTLVYIVDAQIDDLAHLDEPVDHAANDRIQALSVQAANLVARGWKAGGFTPAQSEQLQGLVQQAFDQLQAEPIIRAARKAGYASPDYLTGHVARTCFYSLLLAERARAWVVRQRKRNSSATGLSDYVAGNMMPLGLGALLMDGGMSQIQGLEAPGVVPAIKQQMVMAHAEKSIELLPPGMPNLVKMVVASHHENLDGSGYPNHLAGDRVHIFSRIVRIADSFDAGTSPRAWRKAKPAIQVLWEMSRYGDRAGQYDAELVDMFLQLMTPLPVGTLIEMQDGYFAAVVGQTRHPFFPRVVLLMDPKRQRVSASELEQSMDLSEPKAPRMGSLHGESLRFLYNDAPGNRRNKAA